jgi:hypothetical protein
MTQPVQYSIRDSFGNVYGPASIELLRQWVREGRIAVGMLIAPEGTMEWIDVSSHPGLADLFGKPALPYAQPVQTPVQTTTAPVELSYHRPPRTHPLAIVSFISAIIGLCSCCCLLFGPFGVLPGTAALITGIIALRQIEARPLEYTGTPLTSAGIVLGSIVLCVQLLFWGMMLLKMFVDFTR